LILDFIAPYGFFTRINPDPNLEVPKGARVRLYDSGVVCVDDGPPLPIPPELFRSVHEVLAYTSLGCPRRVEMLFETRTFTQSVEPAPLPSTCTFTDSSGGTFEVDHATMRELGRGVSHRATTLFARQLAAHGFATEHAWEQCLRLARWELTEAARGIMALAAWISGAKCGRDGR